MIPNTPPGQRRSGFVRSISRSWSGVESPCCPATAPKHHCSRGDLHGGMGQNTSNSVWKPCEDLQKTFDLCHCQQRVYNKVLRLNLVIDQILIFHHNLQINYLKILQCDFLDFFSYFVSHSWGIHMMKITGLSHLFKWENLHNWWLTKYFFVPLYIYIYIYIYIKKIGAVDCGRAWIIRFNWSFSKTVVFVEALMNTVDILRVLPEDLTKQEVTGGIKPLSWGCWKIRES